MTVPSPPPAPRVSVVLATWNWSSALACSIPSVLAQTFDDFELLVVGDGCSDDSAAVVASFGDPRIRWHNLPERTGSQVAPNNTGLALARAPLIAYLGHDDLWHPEHLAATVDALERTQADLAWGVTLLYGPPDGGLRAIAGLAPPAARVPPPFVPPSSWVHRRELLERIGRWRDHRELAEPHDHELLHRAWAAGARLAGSGELTVFKFPASWRRDVYVQRSTDEQRALLARMREPRFRERELLVALAAQAAGKLIDVGASAAGAPGELVELAKAFKGAGGALPRESRTATLRYRFDRDLPGFEWHAVERDSRWGTFQWSGPSSSPSLLLPLANDRDLDLTVHVLAPLLPSVLDSTRLEVNGERVAMRRETTAEGTTRWRARLPAAVLARSAGAVRLVFHGVATVRPCDLDPASTDRRNVGLAFHRLEVAPADEVSQHTASGRTLSDS